MKSPNGRKCDPHKYEAVLIVGAHRALTFFRKSVWCSMARCRVDLRGVKCVASFLEYSHIESH